jgi:hypothetical protein
VKPKAGQLSDLLERCEGIAAHEARRMDAGFSMLVKMLKRWGTYGK